jgi:hypothetical protein
LFRLSFKVRYEAAVLDQVARAMRCARAGVRQDLKEGVYDLATTASIAPWIGIFGTILGIVNSFQGFSGLRWVVFAAILGGISGAMWFTAMGLLVGLLAMWCYRYLSERLAALDREMENASLDLLNQLTRFPAGLAVQPSGNFSTFGQGPAEDIEREGEFLRRSLHASLILLALAWLAKAWRLSALSACLSTPFVFGCCCVFVYPFWSRVLRRRPGAMVVLASVLCFCWSIAELMWGALP